MEQLVTVIQRLHEALGAMGDASIRLPAIVAVGGQSSGKSSVLEGIVGRDFLPRGNGIVTRRPVMMYLHNVPRTEETVAEAAAAGTSSSSSSNTPQIDRAEWCEFQHKPGFRHYNFDDVRTELVREMERVAGRNKGISVEPICLTIHSPRVPDLVIIDLPGITKVPVGDQPADIEMQIRRLCLHYMCQQNNIILAVHPANQDLANSDALKLALEADPEGERTIGVLTKVDLMDPGTDARDVLSGRVIPLRRGFVPVVCRSQKDILDSMPMTDGLTRERTFFERHYAYRAMASRCGISYLTRVLSHMLFSAIRAHLPSIRSQLSLAAQSYEQQLRELGDPVEASGPREQGHLLLKLLSRFASNFCDMIEGRVHADAGSDLLIDELFGGARIQEIIRTRFNQWTAEWESLMDSQLRDDEILMATRNSAGPRSALFIPEQAFTSLVRRQIVQLKDLGRRFADEIYDELRRIAERCEPPQLYRFGELREKAVEVVQNLLRRAFLPTVDMIDRLIDIELSHVNTTHPDFIGAARALEYVLLEDREAGVSLGATRGGLMDNYVQNHQHYGGNNSNNNNNADPNADDVEPSASPMGRHHHHHQQQFQSKYQDAASNNAAPDDVLWAMNRLGVQGGNGKGVSNAAANNNNNNKQGNSNESSNNGDAYSGGGGGALAGLLGVFGRVRGRPLPANSSSAATTMAATSNNPNKGADDIRARFGPRVVNEMLGDDGGLFLGAVKRVGGPNSPFVELPRPSPLSKAAAAAANNGGNGGFMGGAGGFSYPGSPAVLLGGGRGGGGWASPGSVNGVSTLPSSASANASNNNNGGGMNNNNNNNNNNNYHGMSLLVVPSKPLPEVITPTDLRPDEKEKREIRVIRVLLQSYLAIVKKNYTDTVPKTVMCMLVNRVKDEIASELVHHLYTQITSVDSLLRETDDVAGRRRELVDQLSVLNKGINILNEIRDSGIITAPPHSSVSGMHANSSNNNSNGIHNQSSSDSNSNNNNNNGYGYAAPAHLADYAGNRVAGGAPASPPTASQYSGAGGGLNNNNSSSGNNNSNNNNNSRSGNGYYAGPVSGLQGSSPGAASTTESVSSVMSSVSANNGQEQRNGNGPKRNEKTFGGSSSQQQQAIPTRNLPQLRAGV